MLVRRLFTNGSLQSACYVKTDSQLDKVKGGRTRYNIGTEARASSVSLPHQRLCNGAWTSYQDNAILI